MNALFDINKVVWRSEYNIGNLKTDKEHQALFLLARKALSINHKNNKDDTKTILKNIITELFSYVKIHFSNEEEFMEKINYPELESHKKLHANMLTTLTKLLSELVNLDISKIEIILFEFIEEYFVKHIITEDKKIHLWNLPLEELRKSFGWKEIYSINNKQIDNEHKQLFDIAQEAFEIVNSSDRNSKIKNIITDLYDYLKTHFKHEEEYMLSINYPKLKEHENLHNEIIENINNFIKQLSTMSIEVFEKELARIIDIALVQHIIQEDKKIIDWTNGDSFISKINSI